MARLCFVCGNLITTRMIYGDISIAQGVTPPRFVSSASVPLEIWTLERLKMWKVEKLFCERKMILRARVV